MRRALVIGNGAAGTFASWLLARDGWEVTLVGRGTPAAALSAGCLRTEAKVGGAEISEFLQNDRAPWSAGAREGVSRIGTPFRCWMSPSHSTWGEGEAPGSIAVVGLEGHPSLPARTASAMLNERGIRAEPTLIGNAVPSDAPPVSFFCGEGAWESLAEVLDRLSFEAVLLPAFLSLQDYGRLDQLERRCGRKVYEAISPLGPPGQRLAEIMLTKAKAAGVAIWDGRKVAALEVRGDEVRKATVRGGSDMREVAVDAMIMATGGPLVDGLMLRGREITDPFGIFRVVRQDDGLRGGYDQRDRRLVTMDGLTMANATGAGDCLSREGRTYGCGLTEALEDAYLAVRSLEGA